MILTSSTRVMYFSKVSIAFALSLLLFSSCFLAIIHVAGKRVKEEGLEKITIENGAIPPDFGKDPSTLICILIDTKNYNKNLRKISAAEYHGTCEYISPPPTPVLTPPLFPFVLILIIYGALDRIVAAAAAVGVTGDEEERVERVLEEEEEEEREAAIAVAVGVVERD